jgi:hypothetical protein
MPAVGTTLLIGPEWVARYTGIIAAVSGTAEGRQYVPIVFIYIKIDSKMLCSPCYSAKF